MLTHSLSRRRAQWGQLPIITKAGIASIATFFLLALLWGVGTVDVDYVRSQLNSFAPGNEPIPTDASLTPIIDGVPNDLNDRPIPDGIIEEDQHVDNASSEVADDSLIDSLVVSRSVADAKTGAIAGGLPIRVMFMGASITLGDPPQSAYRMQLREWLVSLGNQVNCVGSVRFGQFKDNDVQAFAATPVKVIHDKSVDAVPAMQPNLIIVNAGSSDCFQEQQWGSAHGYDYTKSLVDFLFTASPQTTVILSTLVTSPDATFERCIVSFNAQIRQVARDVARSGKKILLSEQHWDQGLPGRVTPDLIKSDKMHPTFQGWQMMGEIYKQDIRDADAKGWIVAPVANGIMYDGDAERDLLDAGKPAVGPGGGQPGSGGSPSNSVPPANPTVTSHARQLRWNQFWG